MTIDHSQNPQALLRLMTWLSPAFPIGGFSYSHGLEAAIANGTVINRVGLHDWIKTLISVGSVWNDCVLLGQAHSAIMPENRAYCLAMAEALAGSKERHLETMKQGAAFLSAAREWLSEDLPQVAALPVAVGFAAQLNGISKHETLVAYLQAFATNQLQAALRLMPLGQTNSLWVQKTLEEAILNVAAKALNSSFDDFGSSTVFAEIAAMQHETLRSRIFRS
ncbi:urease accessory protein UreF [Ahrensia marina]|uniref:Urease accessory protein UreF n=1 Tax=Ahrensia marina TaxID=1514904 RepID=A0A0M9GNW2_9HYPH|nr:urease accessory protein UreF [Ahrensia marina]KPB02203.1 hypothetical protein SU32_04165 [Ahrensia marina]